MKAGLWAFTGVAGFLFGAAVAAALVIALYVAVGPRGEPRGGETIFKIAWTTAAFGIGPIGAVAFSIAAGDRLRLGPGVVAAVVSALAIYGVTAWALVPVLSVMNDCSFGVTWPDPSIPGCD